MTQLDGTPRALSRRDLLKRGAVVGAATAWTVPLVQVVSMTPAHADSPSAPPPVNPPPVTPPATPPVTPPTHATSKPPPHPPTSSHAGVVPAVAEHAAPAPVAAGPSALANTGVNYPVAPTVGLGAAAIALGAGALGAARVIKNRQEDGAE